MGKSIVSKTQNIGYMLSCFYIQLRVNLLFCSRIIIKIVYNDLNDKKFCNCDLFKGEKIIHKIFIFVN